MPTLAQAFLPLPQTIPATHSPLPRASPRTQPAPPKCLLSRVSGKTVLVTGATGATGRLICAALALRGADVRALIRPRTYIHDRPRVHAVRDDCPFVRYVMGDLRDESSLVSAVRGADAVVCAAGSRNFEGADPNRPEIVDWKGVATLVNVFLEAQMERELIAMFGGDQREMERGSLHDTNPDTNVVEDTLTLDVSKFVLVSSLGVTRPHRFPQLQQMGAVLRYKMCGEDALRDSRCPFTIVRPGGFVDAPRGQARIIIDQGDRIAGSVPRGDVADICAEALFNPKATNITLECVAQPGATDGDSGTRDFFEGLVPDAL